MSPSHPGPATPLSRFRSHLRCLALLCAAAQPTHAAEPPAAPILRMEAGMHTAPINRIATDAQGRWAVTASDDKTARVWEVASGRLLQVLRPPIGQGNEGKLYALAVSPDGAVVATAGWTGYEWSRKNDIYLFSRSSGELLRRLPGIPNVIHRLTFSRDGQWLAATLATGGIQVWRWKEDVPPLFDRDYGGASYGADFSARTLAERNGDALLATSSLDGKVRLYQLPRKTSPGMQLSPLDVASIRGGKYPFGVAFSPDGSRLAVGYEDSSKVELMSVTGNGRLELQKRPNTDGVDNGNIGSVAFSDDGRYLAAGGRWEINGFKAVRRWDIEKLDSPEDSKTSARVSLMDLTRLPTVAGGGWLVSSGDPAWGIVATEGRWYPRGSPPTADLRGSRGNSAFLLGSGGLTVQFGFEEGGISPYKFDLLKRELTPGLLPDGKPPITTGIRVENWINHSRPMLDQRPIKLDVNDVSRSVAALPNGAGFILGTQYRLRSYGPNGVELWPPLMAPGSVWGVNAPQTGQLAGKVVVAAYGDGTIRWHRISDGQEILSFFSHADRKRWVLWTPSGYYDASLGGEELIGWHVNRGADTAADFFPASRFRERFHRPDVLDLVMQTLDEATAVALANDAAGRREALVSVAQVLPPVLDLVSAPERFDQTRVPVRIRVRVPADAPATRLRVLVNGEIMPTARGAKAMHADGSEDLWLNLPPANSEVQVYADNRHGSSLPLKLSLAWAGEQKAFVPGQQGEQTARRSRLWLLAVGVSKYQDPAVPALSYAHADASAFARLMQAQQGKAYETVTTRVLLDAQATRQAVLDGLDWLQTAVRPGDVGMVFLAGHGFTMATDHRYFYGNHDVQLARLTETGVPYKAIQEAMVNFNLRGEGTRAVFFIDTCHAGDASGTRVLGNVKTSNADNLAGELSRQENQVLVFASSKGDQFSIEDPRLGHGVFTKALIEGLGDEWRADPFGLGSVTYTGLNAWVSARVPVLSQRRQTPRLLAPPGGVDDFSLATKQ